MPPKKLCPMELGCSMYKLFRLAGMQGMWQSLYCHSDYERCERYRLDAKGQPVPQHLLPDGKLLSLNTIGPPGARGKKK